MDQILDLDAAPPYVEVYAHAPLMYMSLSNQRRGCAAVPPRQLLLWWHDVQCRIDGVASSLGLYKIKVTGQHGSSCLFSISPDMPAKQQADVMLAAAQQLKGVLAQVRQRGGAGAAPCARARGVVLKTCAGSAAVHCGGCRQRAAATLPRSAVVTHRPRHCCLAAPRPPQVLLPDGCALASQITIHAGQYAGGVIGRGAWTYE